MGLEKDKKMNEIREDELILLEIENNIGSCITATLLNIFGIIFCLMFFFLFENYFVKTLSFIGVLILLYNIANILVFKKLTFTDKRIIKKYFNPMKFCIANDSLEYTKMNVQFWNRILNSRLTFWEKGKKWRTKWKYSFSLIGIDDKNIKNIKQILTYKEVIKGDEYEWNYY